MDSVKVHLHKMYDGFEEIDALSNGQDSNFEIIENEIERFIRNQFVATCELSKLEEFERILKIPAKNESIEFRRERVLNRLNMIPPFTLVFLRMKLDAIIGVGNYKAYVDYNKYTLYVESSAKNQEYFIETLVTINKIKPANIVFINKPITTSNILVNEKVNLTQRKYNYILGKWQLGKEPFSKIISEEVLKMPNEQSIKETLTDTLKETTVANISYILLNDKVKIAEFIHKDIIDNKVVVEYEVRKNIGIEEINKVTLHSKEDTILTELNVYIPLVNDLEIKHEIDIKEGV